MLLEAAIAIQRHAHCRYMTAYQKFNPKQNRAGFALGKRSQRGVIAAKYCSVQASFVAALILNI